MGAASATTRDSGGSSMTGAAETDCDHPKFGPLQLLAVRFDEPRFTGKILGEFRRLREHGIVRLVDLLVVAKDEHGELTTLETSDLSKQQLRDLGAIVGALIGFGAEQEGGVEKGIEAGAEILEQGVFDGEDRWAVADTLPAGCAAAIALLEHRWAIPLREAIAETNGRAVVDEWIHPADFIATGAALAARAAADGPH
ncbi:hypothetical protein HII36_34190 [Nonomuraea sp. NN258]|uniref:DUF6325 family protein n=1 Tax=Nonomuraea antri TaxID=2730852 RepID=UPI001568098C|nr:DUF6325 family protein [Nonomuraea antri]NRQ36853.1 hypothetical protein [Nonomuraea antri]